MLVNWSEVLSNKNEKTVWRQFVNRKLSARKLDGVVFYTQPTVKTMVNKFGVERLRDMARKALNRRG